jgi:hypothetical protein
MLQIIEVPQFSGDQVQQVRECRKWIRARRKHPSQVFALKLYHGTDPSLPICDQGLLPTSAKRRRSFQSASGFVYSGSNAGSPLVGSRRRRNRSKTTAASPFGFARVVWLKTPHPAASTYGAQRQEKIMQFFFIGGQFVTIAVDAALLAVLKSARDDLAKRTAVASIASGNKKWIEFANWPFLASVRVVVDGRVSCWRDLDEILNEFGDPAPAAPAVERTVYIDVVSDEGPEYAKLTVTPFFVARLLELQELVEHHSLSEVRCQVADIWPGEDLDLQATEMVVIGEQFWFTAMSRHADVAVQTRCFGSAQFFQALAETPANEPVYLSCDPAGLRHCVQGDETEPAEVV